MGKSFLTEGLKLRGRLSYTVYRNGIPIERFCDDNLIMNAMRYKILHMIAGDLLDDAESDIAGVSVNRIALGTSGSEMSVADTEITNPFYKAIKSFDYPKINQVRFLWKILETEANGKAIREFGLITDDGSLFARRIRDKPLQKESDISIEGEWIISI